MKLYDVRDWYWYVGGDTTRAFSSAIGDYVPSSDATFQAWLSDGSSPTRIISESGLGEVLANASVRPVNTGILDNYRTSQASKLTMELVAKVLFNHENRIRVLESKPTITAAQFANALKAML